MANPFSNKKKIRGWKKQVKKIDKWKNANMKFNTYAIKTGHNRDHLKIWIDPWYRLVKRNPPLWYSRIILDNMIEIYMNWYEALSKLEGPFNLKIWLFEPDFIRSQVVWDFGSIYGFYDNTFEKSNEIRDFPFDKYKTQRYDLKTFTWKLYVDYNCKFKKLDELSDEDIDLLVKKGYLSEIVKSTDDIVYKKRTNCVWVGSLNAGI
ncbi:MAG TPA: hypothetical protein VHT96_06570 [Clostridia bacterium]|nr:hypothetical protein [Clostridia bacterium]